MSFPHTFYRSSRSFFPSQAAVVCAIVALVFSLAGSLLRAKAREKDAVQYGAGFSANLPFSEAEVEQVVLDVVQNGIIRGTKEYNADEFIKGAVSSDTSNAFPQWTEGGKVFYKIRLKALDPRNFKNTNDVGTISIRYIVQKQDEKHTILRIDARFVEDFRHLTHPSNGSVENAEFKDIHDKLDSLQQMKDQAVQAEKEKQRPSSSSSSTQTRAMLNDESSAASASAGPIPAATPVKADVPEALNAPAAAPASNSPASPPQTLEEHVKDLRQKVERLVKSPGAPLKSAPFHTASTLKSLPPGTEVLIVVTTPYWLGVETHEGQHGWMLRDDLELLP